MEAAGNIGMRAATRIAAMVAAACVTASGSPAIGATINWPIPIAVTRPTVSITRPVAVPGATVPAASVITASTPVAVIPRPCADEHAAYKPIRPVIARRCAGIRVVATISIWAYRSRTHARVNWTDANAH